MRYGIIINALPSQGSENHNTMQKKITGVN